MAAFALSLFIAGLIIFIVGLARNKKSFSFALIIGLYSITLLSYRNYPQSIKTHPDIEFKLWDDTFYADSDSLEISHSGKDYISGIISDEYNNNHRITIFTDNKLKDEGISVIKIGQPTDRNDDSLLRIISCYFVFTKDFRGLITLEGVDNDDNIIGNSKVELSQPRGMHLYIDFTFDDTEIISESSHFELRLEEL